MKSFIVVPDIHFGLNRSYVNIDYPLYIYDFFKDLVIDRYPEHHIILLGDIKENAGVRSAYELAENELLDSIKHRLTVVKGNGKHCYDHVKHGDTFESVNGVDKGVIEIGDVSIGLLGYTKEQEELDEALKAFTDVDILCTHNFIEKVGPTAPYIKNANDFGPLILAGHNHKQADFGNAICLGSLVNWDFGTFSDNAWIYESSADDIIEIPRYQFNKIIWKEGLKVEKLEGCTRLVVPADRPDIIAEYSELVDDIELLSAEKPETTEVSLVEEKTILEAWDIFASKDKNVAKKGWEVLNAVQ